MSRFTGLSVHRREIQIWSQKDGLRKARNGPRPTDQTDSELSIKMFTQPRLRRFLCLAIKYITLTSRVHHRCYLSPSEECTFRICLKSIYQPI